MKRYLTHVFAIGLVLAMFAASAELNGRGAQQQATENDEVGLASDLVEIFVSCTDRDGRPIQGLTAADFEVRDNGSPQQVAHFSDATGSVAIGIVLDTTGMTDEGVVRVLTALRESRLTTSGVADVALVAYNERASIDMDFIGLPEQVLPELRFAQRRARLGVREAIERVEKRISTPPGTRRAVVLITGGLSQLGPRSVETGVELGQTELYAVFTPPSGPSSGSGVADRAGTFPAWQWWKGYAPVVGERSDIARLAVRSGGRALGARSQDRENWIGLFDRIAGEVGNQYAIGFYPSSRARGVHRVTVTLARQTEARGATLTHRRSYRVP